MSVTSDERYFEISPDGKIVLPALPRDCRWQYLRTESTAGGPMYGVFKVDADEGNHNNGPGA